MWRRRPTHDEQLDLDRQFVALYRREADALLRFFVRRTFEVQVAMDLTAETFAAAFAGRGSFRGETDEELSSWLYGIARNQLRRYARDGIAERRALERLDIASPRLSDDDVQRVEEQCFAEQVHIALHEGLDALPEAQREAIRLRVVEGLPYEEVARRLGITVAAARVRVFRGVERLQRSLDQSTSLEGSERR